LAKHWAFCRGCDPTMTKAVVAEYPVLGDINYDGIDEADEVCTVLVTRFRFTSEGAADHYVGAGNHSGVTVGAETYWMTDKWALFFDGTDTYARDGSRPLPCAIETDVHSSFRYPKVIDINGGEFVWTRQSDDPLDPDFQVWEQTAGVLYKEECCVEFCLGLQIAQRRPSWVWEGDPFDVEIGFSTTDTDDPCPQLDGMTVCLPYVEDSSDIIDDWKFGGAWLKYEAPFDVECPAAVEGHREGFFVSSDEHMRAGLSLVSVTCSAGTRWEFNGCRDPLTAPTTGDFEMIEESCDATTFTTLNLEAECEDPANDNCPPEDCPTSFCKWEWDPDTLTWSLISTNCLPSMECPNEPDDPENPEEAWTFCNCCIQEQPECGPGFAECPGDTCTWTWSDLGNAWNSTSCIGALCECQGEPQRDGLFDGEVTDGVCCEE
jgi:hypothetical protein